MKDLVPVKRGGGVLYAEINYDIGGYSYFTSSVRTRGYYVTVQNSRNEFQAFAGLDKPSGATRMLVEETKRFSQKKLEALQKDLEFWVDEVIKESARRGVLPMVYDSWEKVEIKGDK